MITSPLDIIPNLEKDRVESWAFECVARMNKQDFRTEESLSAVSTPPVGSDALECFISAALLADWACYSKPEDRVNYVRLRSVMTAFSEGFRVYFSSPEDGAPVPVGYTGWYPVAEDIFERLCSEPHNITNRGFMSPLREIPDGGAYIYLFNYSVVSSLRGSAQSRALVNDYATVLKSVLVRGMVTVAVSGDGSRVAEKFGLSYRGDMTHDGVAEKVYAACL